MKGKTFESLPRMAALAAACLLPAVCGAQNLDAQRFTVRGFGTIAATTQDNDDIEFRRTVGQGRGVSGGSLELYTDSIAGIQFDAKIASNVDVMVQGVSRLGADGDWNSELTQGFVRYSPDESLELRFGRLGYDIYLLAESRQVGYSYLALRPAPEFYGLLTNDVIDGADVSYTRRIGRGLARARLFGGGASSETAFVDGGHSDTNGSIVGACFDYLYQGWTARVAMIRFEYETDSQLRQLAAGLRMTGLPESVAIANEIDHPELSSAGIQLGVAYDDGPLQAQLLYGLVDSGSIAGPSFQNVYALAGYRLRQFTPYASFASSVDRDPPRGTGLPPLSMFAPLNGAVAQIQDNLRSTQHTASVGVRYDFSSHVDVKLQIDRVALRDSALMFDRRTTPGAPVDFTVAAVAVDFVF
jgi:hypothetical protein